MLDNGFVGYSNPVRQSLYTHADAVSGNRMKATTAAERLLEINPSAVTEGHVLQIPMPGHTIGESLRVQTEQNLQLIEEKVRSHDVIFLLTDSRESRWLPTLLGAVHQKVCCLYQHFINCIPYISSSIDCHQCCAGLR